MLRWYYIPGEYDRYFSGHMHNGRREVQTWSTVPHYREPGRANVSVTSRYVRWIALTLTSCNIAVCCFFPVKFRNFDILERYSLRYTIDRSQTMMFWNLEKCNLLRCLTHGRSCVSIWLPMTPVSIFIDGEQFTRYSRTILGNFDIIYHYYKELHHKFWSTTEWIIPTNTGKSLSFNTSFYTRRHSRAHIHSFVQALTITHTHSRTDK
jgi:hypothetical protein